MRSFKYINDPKAFDVIADETSRKIVYLLRAKEMTVSQIADAMGKTSQAIYYQIAKLKEVGLVEVAREERVKHFIETYYRATAEVFEFRHGESKGHGREKETQEALDALKTVGLNFDVNEDMVAGLANVLNELHGGGLSPEMEEKISQLPDVGFFTRQLAYEVARYATMSDKQFEHMLADTKETRKLLVSSLVKKEKREPHQ